MTDVLPVRLHRRTGFRKARTLLNRLGLTFALRDRTYYVNVRGGRADTAYYTMDLDDAVTVGTEMAARAKGRDVSNALPDERERARSVSGSR